MKNILIYVNPNKEFDEETARLVKIQIDNSLELGWKREDILLVTNFPYEYNGVKSILTEDDNYCKILKQGTKVDTIDSLFEKGFFENEIYWGHDFDAYQLEPITEEELELKGVDIGLTDYGRKERWNGGSYFFNNKCGNIFHWVKDWMYRHNKNEEYALVALTEENFNNINSRIKRLNISYNFGVRKIKLCYDKAIKPIKVAHFHPDRIYWGRTNAMQIMTGKNEIGKSILSERLINIFKKYGYRSYK